MTLKPRADTDPIQKVCNTTQHVFCASVKLCQSLCHYSVHMDDGSPALEMQNTSCQSNFLSVQQWRRRRGEKRGKSVCVCIRERKTKRGEAEREGGSLEREVGS